MFKLYCHCIFNKDLKIKIKIIQRRRKRALLFLYPSMVFFYILVLWMLMRTYRTGYTYYIYMSIPQFCICFFLPVKIDVDLKLLAVVSITILFLEYLFFFQTLLKLWKFNYVDIVVGKGRATHTRILFCPKLSPWFPSCLIPRKNKTK